MELLNYLFKVSVCLTVFYAVYQLLLVKLTFFKFNRFYLLAGLLLSFAIPALNVTVTKTVNEPVMDVAPVSASKTVVQVPPHPDLGSVPNPTAKEERQQPVDWPGLALIAYLFVAFTISGFAVLRLVKLLRYIKSSGQRHEGLRIINKGEGFTNCSFFHYIFVDGNRLSEQELNILIAHETVHATQYHSLDKLLLLLAKAVLWFNPVIYMYSSALEQVHEYEADDIASAGLGTAGYAALLLQLSIVETNMPLVHHFVKSPVKARIKMLFNPKSYQMKTLYYALLIPLSAVLVWIFSIRFTYAQTVPKPVLKKKKELALPNVRQTDPYFNSVDYLKKRKICKEIMGKTLSGVIGERYQKKPNVFEDGILFKVDSSKYLLAINQLDHQTLEQLKPLDVIQVKVSTTAFGVQGGAQILITPETITKNGKLIYQQPKTEAFPFGYEANGVRFNDAKISGITMQGKQKLLRMKANGYHFKVFINPAQVAIEDFDQYKTGDQVRMRFVHEVKTGDHSYSVKDWISISKDIRTYGIQNRQLFNRFYDADGKQKPRQLKASKLSGTGRLNQDTSFRFVQTVRKNQAAQNRAKQAIVQGRRLTYSGDSSGLDKTRQILTIAGHSKMALGAVEITGAA